MTTKPNRVPRQSASPIRSISPETGWQPTTEELGPLHPWELIFEGQKVRIVHKDDDRWFVAADVCAILSIDNTTHAVERLEPDWQQVATVRTGGRARELNLVNEPGLYSLIMASRKDGARRFKRWLFTDVLPQIRRFGRYDASQGAGPGSSGPGEPDDASFDWEDRHQLQTLLPKPIPLRLPDFGLFMVTATPERPPHIRQIPLDEVRETLTAEYFRSECMLLIASLLRIEAFSRRDRLRLGLGDSQTRASSQEFEHAIDEGGALARKIGIQFRTAPDTPAAAS